ncbi:hypothetical protein KEM48_001316 [Puccinia striiformis f. sp. tritici PST-130]|nr:hypothetical protein KEM48_001316 [Puccinia striiformis f. sp. tritici PST-130]
MKLKQSVSLDQKSLTEPFPPPPPQQQQQENLQQPQDIPAPFTLPVRSSHPPTPVRFSDTSIRKTKSLIEIHPPFPPIIIVIIVIIDHNPISNLRSFNLTKIVNNLPWSSKVMTTNPAPSKNKTVFGNR